MEQGKKLAIGGSVLLVIVAGIRIGLIYRERHEAEKPAPVVLQKIDPDYNVFLKKERPDSLKDEKALKGRTLWISAGGQMDFFPYEHGKVEYDKTQGVLLGAEPIVVQDAIEAKAPNIPAATFRIPAGEKQVLLVFTKPTTGATEYAVPVGYVERGAYTFSTDEIFFYDDPHILYKHWGPEIWKAVDEHKVIPGMTEREAMMALGQVLKPGDGNEGDRSIRFDHQGHPIDVTFVHNKATDIKPE